jgi:hypothetical protein
MEVYHEVELPTPPSKAVEAHWQAYLHDSTEGSAECAIVIIVPSTPLSALPAIDATMNAAINAANVQLSTVSSEVAES